MVCLGNICRSPLAEGILRDKIRKHGLNWIVDSAGTSRYHIDEPPHPLSQKVAALHGIDLSGLRGRQFKKEDMLQFDKVYVMDPDNLIEVQRISGSYWDAEKVNLICNELNPGANQPVPDPWYGTEKGYHEVYDLLNNACNAIIGRYAIHKKK
jgi:protein-tyrosine phosphatase